MNSAWKPPIFLDGFSTTPLAPEARDAMLEALSVTGNAGSMHYAGEHAATTVMKARSAVAGLIGAAASEITFTSGATEANNLAILGVARWAKQARPERRRIIVSSIEHKAVSAPVDHLSAAGFEAVVAPVDVSGRVDLKVLSELVDGNTLLVCVMAANNETGAIQPVAEVTAMAHKCGALVHCDAAQAAGKIAIDVLSLGVDYLSLSAHKFYGPMGVGALYVSAVAPQPTPLLFGGGQQSGLRPGTEPVPLIAAFGTAAALASARMSDDSRHGRGLAEEFVRQLSEHQVRFSKTTGQALVVPGGLSLMFNDIDAEDIVMAIGKQVSISTGSACTSGQLMPSHVLKAMSINDRDARSVLRLFFNRYNTIDEVQISVGIIASAAGKFARATGRPRQ
ncbi:cysteine desulfurase [Rhizobium leguminosarum]|uniref:cysteine desulfurase family protein n=1 Tax=Rhizobium leguminosarum TaxID=384 RepID=UPI001C96541F|nr:cysteine desulfurase family protein [Rhizobium leguminosarum]MBY5760171.1 cysteine desulfurase [Rhizobium leguminosarum]